MAIFLPPQDTIYIEEPTAAAAALRSRGAPAQAERQRLMSYWGVKFEQYCVWPTRERPTLAQRQQHCQTPVNNSEAYCVVLRSRLGAHNLIFGAEVDCAGTTAVRGGQKVSLLRSQALAGRTHVNEGT